MKRFNSKIQAETDDKLLYRYSRNNDRDAFGILFKRYMPLVYGLCLKYLKDRNRAQDAVMDIFVKLGEKLKMQEVSHFKAWLYTVSKNHCFELLRREKRIDVREKEAEIMYSGRIFHPDNEKDDETLWLQMEKCIEKLSEKQKTCIDLFYFQSKTYNYISEVLQMSWAQVRSNIQNGRRNLKNCLEQYEKGK